MFFNTSIVPSFITEYTDMTVSSVTQRMGIHYSGNLQTLQAVLTHVSPDVEHDENEKGLKTFRLFSAIDVIVDKTLVTLEVQKLIPFHKHELIIVMFLVGS